MQRTLKKIKRKCIWINDRICFYIGNIFIPIIYFIKPKNIGINIENQRDKKIIVSMTSFPERMNKIHLCIEGLLRQSYKPDKIILYLANDQFENIEIPKKVLKLKDRGLEIRFCDDLKPHKKYYYAIKDYPNDIIITVDDDAFYKGNLIKKLVESYERYPNAISCTRAHYITFDEKNKINPYNLWEYESSITNRESKLLFATGVGGVLYPPKSMSEELFNKENIVELCLYADDVWLKAMQLLKGTKVIKIPSKKTTFCIGIFGAENISLFKSNVLENNNDQYIEKVFNKYNITIQNFKE